MIHLLVAVLVALPPTPSAWVAALILGRPEIAPALVRVCERESRCERVGIHERDAWLSHRSWGGQVQLGHLDARCQPRGPGRRWATRGAWGMNAADAWPYMPACYEPESLDVPIVGTFAAGGFYLARCDGDPRRKRARWCPGSGA